MKKQSRVDEQKLTAGTKAAPKNQNDLFKQEKNAPNNPSPGNMGAKANAGGQAERPEREEEQAKTGRRQRPDKAKKAELNFSSLHFTPLEKQIIQRHRQQHNSVEEVVLEMVLCKIQARRIECITQALLDERGPITIYSKPDDKIHISLYDGPGSRYSSWSPQPENPYLFLDCFNIHRCVDGKLKRVSILLAIRVTRHGFQDFIQVREAVREGKAMWRFFFREINLPKLDGIQLVISKPFPGLTEFLRDFTPRVRWQHCLEDWYQNALARCPKEKRRALSKRLKTIHKEDDSFAARERAFQITSRFKFPNRENFVNYIASSLNDTLAYMDFPREYWTPLSTNKEPLSISREIRRCARVIASYPKGKSTQVLLDARLRHLNKDRPVAAWPNPYF